MNFLDLWSFSAFHLSYQCSRLTVSHCPGDTRIFAEGTDIAGPIKMSTLLGLQTWINMNSQDNEETNARAKCNKKMGTNLLTRLCTGWCRKGDQWEAGQPLAWYWSSVWSLNVSRVISEVAGLQAGRTQGQEMGTVCKG